LLDPNTLSSDGTVSIGSISISPSGKLFAYTLSRSGSDWKTVHFRKVDSRQDLPDVLNWVKFSGLEWVENETGFVYSKYPKPVEVDNIDSEKAGAETQKNQFHNVFYHKFGTDPEKDVLIYEDKDHPDYFHNGSVTSDDKYLVLTIW
jgi:prolyl oligopeptidase